MNNNNNNNRRILAEPEYVTWSREEDKIFENSLVTILLIDDRDDDIDRWQKVADLLPGKTADDVKLHYQLLLCDVEDIESGLIHEKDQIQKPTQSSKHTASAGDRKKGRPWTQDEHRLFIKGLETYGKGDWRSISRNLIKTRTPTQVASHAQKYFLRHKTELHKRKRTSIHDITTSTSDPLSITIISAPGPTSCNSNNNIIIM
ncbi:hypothetical protein ACJIZ3_022764 [Penstemon smallii]|uniref:Uncharacterized protein n=1 Tax=Penstemon smallii TaxID=265156 RepID=A0ABD3TQ32_9LAMI